MAILTTRYFAALDGEVRLLDSHLPDAPRGHVRVVTQYSGISAGTEMLMLSNSASARSGQPVPLGYQLTGSVESVADDMRDHFAPGDRVACYGAPYVHHASAVNVPRNLVVKIPRGADILQASFCGLGSVALHAFRCGNLRLGETVAVVGLGMLGNLVAQTAKAAGCRVVACDPVEGRRRAAAQSGVDAVADIAEVASRVGEHTGGNGADVVFIVVADCSTQLLEQSVKMIRLRGKVVIVGTAQAELPRELMFQKEARVMVSRAAGAGRYDAEYELHGRDYPYPYVRWTEGRNLEEHVRLVGAGAIQLAPLITDVVSPEENPHRMLKEASGNHPGIVIRWTES